MKYALLSVWDKQGVEPFAQSLHQMGFTLLSTGGTARTLEAAGLPVLPVSSLTEFPEILDGRVKTLHPKVFGGILARRHREEDRQVMQTHHLPDIQVVAVNLYPFAAKAKEGLSDEALLEFIDIGGPSLVRAAAKNYHDVFVVVDPRDYPKVLEALRKNEEETLELRRELALKAFVHTAVYDATIYTELYRRFYGDPPEILFPVYRRMTTLRYGENPHQKGWAYESLEGGFFSTIQPLWGKALSYNNYTDLYAALALLEDLGDDPTAVIIKHTNPCGVARGDSILTAYTRALEADPISAFGGIVALNRPVDEELAARLNEHFLEIVAAPDFSEKAWNILTQKKNRRLVRFQFPLPKGYEGRTLGKDLLLQEPDIGLWDQKDLEVVSGEIPEGLWDDLAFAFTVVKHVKSNAIVVAREGQTLGIGAGQMNRVQAVRIALEQAGENARGAVLASDAFFPFADSVEEAARAGIRAIVQPGGSRRDDEVIQRARELGVAMVLTKIRHFRHA